MPAAAIPDPRRVVTVRVPATSANLGPGFDSLGMALTLYNTFTFRVSPDDRHHISGVPGEPSSLSTSNPDDNLILKSAWITAMQEIGEFPPMAVHVDAAIPTQRGLGSSATAVVAGILGVSALFGFEAAPRQVLGNAALIEGHADNVAAALKGGIQCVVMLDNKLVVDRTVTIAPSLSERLSVVACVPAMPMGTEASRSALPESVPLDQAKLSVGSAALQVIGWMTGDVDLLRSSFGDGLHEPYRLPLIPGAEWAFERVRKLGAFACCLSGSGSTLLAFCLDEMTAQVVGEDMRETLRIHKNPVEAIHLLRIDTIGATVQISSDPE